MSSNFSTRRQFLKNSVVATAAGITAPSILIYASQDSKNDRLNVAAIGCGGRGSGIGRQAAKLATMVACADVDMQRAEKFASKEKNCASYQDYRKIIDRKDIDVVTIGTPDHWHVKVAMDAMQAGKDVYCEKPLTLTIDEGKKICAAVKEYGRVFQVGTQQRSEYRQNFIKAVAIARSGRLGTKLKATSSVGGAKTGGPFKESDPPPFLDWEMWLGQAQKTGYIKERTHYQFRWWLEYSGGQVTDWGVHHTDIAMWALGVDNTGPTRVQGKGTFDKRKNCYNVASKFDCTMRFKNGNTIVLDSGRNMLTIEGEKGTITVNRSSLAGEPVEEIKNDKAASERLDEEVRKLYKGKRIAGHMQNFFDCIKDRSLPVSDVFSHHRTVSACHLANITMILDRKLKWNPKKEDFVGDEEATAMLTREQREPYQIAVR